MPYRNNEIKSGMIMMWSGLVADVPNGWSICDGTNGTPDLREKFVRGTDGEVGTEGGCSCHDHNTYTYVGGVYGCNSCVPVSTGGCVAAGMGHSHCIGISVYSTSHIPPYYELIFIRKD